MAGFKGKYDYSIDNKGRVNLPAKLRKNLSASANDSFVITRGHEICLYLYPMDVWATVESDFKARLNVHNAEDRLLLRTISMWASEVTLDGQARIMIPQELLKFASISNSVVLIGALERIEIWSPDVFNRYLESFAERSFESVAAQVLGGKPL